MRETSMQTNHALRRYIRWLGLEGRNSTTKSATEICKKQDVVIASY